MDTWLKHMVGDMDGTMVQRCLICGYVVSDYRNAMWPTDCKPPQGYGAGNVYICGGVSMVAQPDEYKNCK